MLYLAVDQTSPEWAKVVKYVQARQLELTGTCVDPMQGEADRLSAAHRINELQALIDAPEQTRADTQRRLDSTREGEIY